MGLSMYNFPELQNLKVFCVTLVCEPNSLFSKIKFVFLAKVSVTVYNSYNVKKYKTFD